MLSSDELESEVLAPEEESVVAEVESEVPAALALEELESEPLLLEALMKR